MKHQFDLDKALRILKIKKITKGQVAERLGYDSSYLSKLISGEKPLTEQFLNAFMKEFGNYLDDVELVIDDPMKELIKANIRLESKVDTLGLMFAAVIERLTPEQKGEVAKVLNNGDYEGKEAFAYFNEAAKKRAEFRLKRSKREEAD
jgi:transcriptional regulator with XRE-family HTH domain